MAQTQSTHFSFLASGPSFDVELPTYIDRLPELSTPLHNGIGGRSFVFIPQNRDVPPEASSKVEDLVGGDGRPVEFYKRPGAPVLWWLRWPLTAGALYTHLREEDGVQMAQPTASAISVIEDDATGRPFITFTDPLTYAASANPGYLESVYYLSAQQGDGWGLRFQRPSFLAPTKAVTKDLTGGGVLLRLGLGDSVEAQIWAGDASAAGDARDLLNGSFARAGGA